ncbi:MAG: hypothetical protein WC928_01595 [Patescibacteria group bacterium]|jgi:hypothetical protein
MNKPKFNFYKGKILILFLIFSFIFGTLSYPFKVQAGPDVIGGPTGVIRGVVDYIKDDLADQLKKAGSLAFQSTLQSVLNTLAFDVATWIGSGEAGQKPLFTTEYLTDLGSKTRDAAIGKFIDTLSKDWQFDLCQPSFDTQVKMGLGLVALSQPEFYAPRCGWQELKSSWVNEYEKWASMSGPDYLSKVANMFEPTGNDVTIALELFGRSAEIGDEEQEKIEEQVKINNGWLDLRNIGGTTDTPPGQAERELQQADSALVQNLGKFTGNALVDASNIFLNQLAITAFNNIVKNLGKKDPDASSDNGGPDYTSSDSDPSSFSGQKYVIESLKKVIKPRFNVRADYNILSDLIVCLDPKNPRPNNCVIDNQFRQAVENKNTVIEAIDNGYLNPDWTLERYSDYTTGFNHRSLIILRKFRIIPLGWEEALNLAEEKTTDKGYRYTLMDFVSCFSSEDDYETYSDGFIKSGYGGEDSNSLWCRGLIDPNWVLKAPLNYCKRQGYGGHIASQQLVNVAEDIYQQTGVKPIIVSRSDNYCADEQSCIKERSDGTCEYYGYCLEEKRIWNFSEDSCDPVYNTCDYFTSVSNGKKLALLKNTLDYEGCDAENVGCKKYVVPLTYDSFNKKVTWDISSSYYFNNKIQSCSANDEGCQEFIRTAVGVGHNFLLNGSFEDDLSIGGWDSYSTSTNFYTGQLSLYLPSSSSLSEDITVASSSYNIGGETYTLSFYSYCSGTATSSFSLGGSLPKNISNSGGFEYQSLTYTFPDIYGSNKVNFTINPNGNSCYIDDIKLEKGAVGTFYSEYRGNGLIYEKIIPEYLKNICYVSPTDFRLKTNAPSECYKYARLCNNDEVGCETFTSIYNLKITGKVLDKNYCPNQCVGYDVYVQKNTLFENRAIEKLIPSSATSCNASQSGCTEFTNLDELAVGGEGKEYYTSLKHCIKPDGGTCENFYSWEGVSGGGYQLKSYSLEAISSSNKNIKLTVGSLTSSSANIWQHEINGSTVCDQNIYNKPVSDPGYNSDCREFYNQAGQIFYILYSKSISCSANCKTYRMTEKNINYAYTDSSGCLSLNQAGQPLVASWDSGLNVCYHCLNGGWWDNTQKACLYKSIPGEGQGCSASVNGCREYNGNSGNSVRIVDSFDFNYGLEDWAGDVSVSTTEALGQGGSSILLTDEMQNNIGNLAKTGSSYIIKFLAKSNQAENLSIYFTDGTAESLFGSVNKDDQEVQGVQISDSDDWTLYQVNLENLDHSVISGEDLVFKISDSSGNVYIANIVLLEISNRYYLIKDSWAVPAICKFDVLGNQQTENYNLGCQNYSDRLNNNHSLINFSKICDDSAVGCEMMVKTNNYNSYNPTNYSFQAVVYDTGKACSSANMGCSLFGKMLVENVYQDTYLKYDPNKATTTNGFLCTNNELGCDAWNSSSQSGTIYFKDPGDNVCQWRSGKIVSGTTEITALNWYKKKVNRCGGTGILCVTDSDCAVNVSCSLDNIDHLCAVDNLKTIGWGGSAIDQPTEDDNKVKWAGLCPIKQAGCTEYIDPVSSFGSNIIINSSFLDLDGDGQIFDFWEEITGACTLDDDEIVCSQNIKYQQNLNIKNNKLYILETKGEQDATIFCVNPIYELDSSNTFLDPLISPVAPSSYFVKVSKNVSGYNKKSFYSGDNNPCWVIYERPSGTFLIGEPDSQIELREAVIDYQLKQNLNSDSCSGADFSKGCVLFNERSYNNGIINPLNFNAYNYTNYSTCSGASCDANTLLKVDPDRVCGKWLACYSYTIDQETNEKICLEMRECNSFNYDGSCRDFVNSFEGERKYTLGRDDNATGYSQLGINSLANMSQIGRDFSFSDNFEDGNLNKWVKASSDQNNNPKKPEVDSAKCLVNRPNSNAISNKKVTYPANGTGFLKVEGDPECGDWIETADVLDLTTNTEYYLSFMVNTDDLNFNEKGVVKIKDSANLDTIDYIINKEPGWREVVFKFKTKNTWVNGVKILLETSGGNNPTYFDNFRVEPVLKTVSSSTDSKFVSATCRLYPAQDSLLCESENKNFVSNGWYGYCLEKDPQNKDVCLLWYPIDSISGIKGSGGASSAFSGYPTTGGAQPYYCAEMSANFDLVEYRDVYFLEANHGTENNDVLYEVNERCSSDDNYFKAENIRYDGDASKCSQAFRGSSTWSGNFSVTTKYCVPDRAKDLIIGTNSEIIFVGDIQGSRPEDNTKRICCTNISPPDAKADYCNLYDSSNCDDLNCYHSDTSYFYLNANIGAFASSGSITTGGSRAGWYKYDGSLNNVENQKGIKLLAYDYTKEECDIVSGEWKLNGNGTNQTQTSGVNGGACLMELDKYVPKCTRVVRGIIPWAQRLKSSSVGLNKYLSTGFAVFIKYVLGLPGTPFGAINTQGKILNSDSVVYAGSALSSGGLYGFPYTCKSFSKTIIPPFSGNWTPCDFLYFDGQKIRVLNPNNLSSPTDYSNNYLPISYSGGYNEFEHYFSRLFLKAKEVTNNSPLYDYNYTRTGSGDQFQTPGLVETRIDYKHQAVKPKIENVTLKDSLGQPISPSAGAITISTPGFYTISFNTEIDAEQVPIKKLVLRVKKFDSDWTNSESSEIIEFYNINPSPNINNPHQVARYLSAGYYTILVKVEDNWDFYHCVDTADKFSSMGTEGNCYECCVEKSFTKKNDVDTSCSLCIGE